MVGPEEEAVQPVRQGAPTPERAPAVLGVFTGGTVSSLEVAAALAARVGQEAPGVVPASLDFLDVPLDGAVRPAIVEVGSPRVTGGVTDHPRAYGRRVGLAPTAPDAIRNDEDVEAWTRVKADLSILWTKEQGRGLLTASELALLTTADRGTQEVRGISVGWDESPCAPGSAWAARLYRLPDALVRDNKDGGPFVTSSVIRSPEEDWYPQALGVWG